MMSRLKCYPLVVPTVFPNHMINLGTPTYFINKINADEKILSIHKNIKYWERRIKNVLAGNAYLSLRYWSGVPYDSTHIEFKRLYSDNVNYDIIEYHGHGFFTIPKGKYIPFPNLCKNHGLSQDEFYNWFDLDLVFEGTRFICIHYQPLSYKYLI